ncbi:DUF6093 family protein [Brachybacterium sp.]|uniref:DUF6093 family protein n=1 Tax=Brachybacterium sp. TaxID=1891286 RepID=UPI002ED0C509
MITAGELEEMRADQVALMFDAVVIDRKAGTHWDEEEQATVPTWDPVYSGAARVALPHGTPIVTASGELVVPRTAMVTVPHGTVPDVGDRVKVVGPRPGVPEYVWVQAVEAAAIPTACRMACGAL